MEYQIEVQIEGECTADADLLRRAALAALIQQDAPPAEVAVVIADDETLRALNQRYLGIDAPTDVLAFPNETRGPFVGVGGQPRYLGDVIVSWPRAAAQAAAAGHETLAELQLLVVHGVLHLLGMDDQEGAARAQMWAAQETILRALEVQVNMPELDA